MPMTIRLEAELRKAVIGKTVDLTDAIVRLAHEAQGESPLELLQFVDPYGHTVFNELQMPAVIRDLKRLFAKARTEEEREALLGVEKLAIKNLTEHHHYLWFYGD